MRGKLFIVCMSVAQRRDPEVLVHARLCARSRLGIPIIENARDDLVAKVKAGLATTKDKILIGILNESIEEAETGLLVDFKLLGLKEPPKVP